MPARKPNEIAGAGSAKFNIIFRLEILVLKNHTSSAKTHSRHSRGRRIASMAAATLSLSMGALSVMAAAAPAAQAGNAPFPQSATAKPCTVTALKPFATGVTTPSGKKLVRYPVHVDCKAGGLKVKMEQRLMEEDKPGSDDGQRPGYTKIPGTPLQFSKAGSKTMYDDYRLTRTEWWEGAEEVYHKVRFQVVSDNGVSSDWIYVQSPIRQITP